MRVWGFKISKHKVFETQIGYWNEWQYFDIECKWNRKCDHAGLRFGIELFGIYLYIEFYDTRHWNDNENRWHKYNEKGEELS